MNFVYDYTLNCPFFSLLLFRSVVRYEDLSLNPYKMTKEILQFYGLPYHPEVKMFLDTHTKQDVGGVSSTYRDSKSAPFHWTKDLTYDEVGGALLLQYGCDIHYCVCV